VPFTLLIQIKTTHQTTTVGRNPRLKNQNSTAGREATKRNKGIIDWDLIAGK
jgi:hypothetical protein